MALDDKREGATADARGGPLAESAAVEAVGGRGDEGRGRGPHWCGGVVPRGGAARVRTALL